MYREYGWLGILNAAVVTFAPVYILRLGGEPLLVGLLTAAPAIIGLLLSLPSAGLIARVRDPWELMLRTRILARLPYLPAALLPLLPGLPQAELFVGLVMLTFIPGNVSMVAFQALLPDLLPPNRRPRILSGWFMRLALVGGTTTLVSGWALDLVPFPLGYQLLFGLGMLTAIWGTLELRGIQPPAGGWSPSRLPVTAMVDVRLWSRPFREFVLVAMVFQVGLGMGMPLLSVYWVRDLRLTTGEVGLLATVYSAAQVFSFLFWGRLSDRRGNGSVLQWSMVTLAAQLLLTAVTAHLALLLVAALLGGIGAGGLQLGLLEGVLQLAPAAERLGYVAAFNMLNFVALFVGPILGSALVGVTATALLLGTAGVIRIAAPVLYVLLRRRGLATA